MANLVTGCAGFIGSHLCEELLRQGETVIGLDSLTDYYSEEAKRRNLSACVGRERFTFAQADLAADDLRPILESVDCVFHLAGQPGVRGSWGGQFDVYVRNNILATQRLLESIKSIGKEIRVVYSSSSSVYGNTDQLPTSESALPKPYSPYGMTKLAAEHLCHLYHDNYGLPVVSLRYFTVYGPRQRPDMAFHLFIKALLRNEPIVVLGDGKQTRDFTFIADIVAANLAAAHKPVEGSVFNLGGGSRISVNDVLKLLESIAGKTPTVHYREKTRGDVRDTAADVTQARQRLGFQPSVSLQEGLKRQFEWEQAIYAPGGST